MVGGKIPQKELSPEWIEAERRGMYEFYKEVAKIERPQKESTTKMRLRNLKTNAEDLYLCEDGQILFKVGEGE